MHRAVIAFVLLPSWWGGLLLLDSIDIVPVAALSAKVPGPETLPSSFHRRMILEATISSVLGTPAIASAAIPPHPSPSLSPPPSTITIATATTSIDSAAAQKARNYDRKSNPLISLESAASLAFDDGESFTERLNYPHPGLRTKASPVTSFGSDLETVVDCLVRSMESDATTPVQYGIDARIIVLRGASLPRQNNSNNYYYSPKKNPSDGPVVVFVNPNVLSRSSEDKMVPWKECCLAIGTDAVAPEGEPPTPSTPSTSLSRGTKQSLLEVDLLRDEFVEVAAQDLTGKPIRLVLGGEPSRAFQHELDHLDGILIVDHATSLEDLPPIIAFLEEPFHAERQRKAFARSTYQGNGPLYY